MLATKYEWQLAVFEDVSRAPMGSWEAVSITYETTPFLMDNYDVTLEGDPVSVLLPSIGVLLNELERLPRETLERVAVEILSPTRGCQPVRELWAYEDSDDKALHYAYVSQDGTMEPSNPSQPRTMTRLKRKFALSDCRGGGDEPAAHEELATTPFPEHRVLEGQNDVGQPSGER